MERVNRKSDDSSCHRRISDVVIPENSEDTEQGNFQSSLSSINTRHIKKLFPNTEKSLRF